MACSADGGAAASSDRDSWRESSETNEDAEKHHNGTKCNDCHDGDIGIADSCDGICCFLNTSSGENRYPGKEKALRNKPVKNPGKQK